MEKAVPFATGYRFKVKQDRLLALEYELSINFSIEDCEIFNKLNLSLCVISIIYNFIRIFNFEDSIFPSLGNYLGVFISVLGIFVYFKCRLGYQSLKAKIIKKNSIFLTVFLGLLFAYFGLKIFSNLIGNEGRTQVTIFAFFLVCVYLCFTCYFVILNFDLVERIKQFNSLN